MRRCVAVLAVLVLASGLAGCSRLFGQRYDNFTAYYNTFYNAKRAFEREEEDLLTDERPVDRNRYLNLFVEPEGTQGEGFTKAVEKGADLLREHPESKWVDDALLLIGKAYFYQGNISGAEQKFRETIALDEDRLEDEARFWLGRTLIAAEQYEDAALALREGIDREGVREEWADKMRLALADVDVREAEWDEAVASLQAGLDGLRDDELAARATFLLGQVYETQERPADAAEAYGRVLDYGPRYELAYAAQIARALTLGLGGEGEQALDALRRMQRDDKNFENRAEIELTRARVLAAVGQPGDARDLLRTLLYDRDPSLRVGNIQGQIHYRLAEVYRDGLRNYIRAAAHYDTAATTIREPDLLDRQATVQAITDAPAQSETFGNYARVAGEITDMDSLLTLGSLDDDAFAEAIEQIRVQRAREAEERARDLARRRSEQGFQGGPGLEGFDETTTRGQDPSAGQTGGNNENAGYLNFRNPVQVQEELIAFQARWGDRPLVPNWRRAAALGGGIEVQEGVAETLGDVPQIETPDRTRDDFVDISGIPRDPFTQQRMRASRAAARYELGNVLFLSLSEPDSASVLYRSVIEEDAESAIAQRAYFALAEAQRALGNTTEAERLYNEVLDRYPDSRFADQARGELGLAPVERVAAADSLGLAEAAYADAYERWKDGDYAEALSQLLTLSEQYSTTPAAAKARLAAGALYTEWAAGNETALLAAEPLVLSDPELPSPAADADAGERAPEQQAPPDSLAGPGAEVLPLAVNASTVFTWIVASEADSLTAARGAASYRERGYDAYVAPGAAAGGAIKYRVGIGQFPGREEARAARFALPEDAPEDSWLLAVPAEGPPRPAAALPATEPPVEAAPVADSTETDSTETDSTETDSTETDSTETDSTETDSTETIDPLAAVDSTGLPMDSVAVAPDSLGEGFDLAAVMADSTLALPDSALALALSNSSLVASDSSFAADAPAEEPWLETLYASIETDFPDTPFAERARTLRDALSELRGEPVPDGALPDGMVGASETDSSRVDGSAELRGEAPLDALKGLFTWSIFASPNREPAEVLVLDIADARYRTALYAEENEEGTTYHVVVGQFATPDAAEAVRPQVLDIPEAEDLLLLDLAPGTALEHPLDVMRRRNQ